MKKYFGLLCFLLLIVSCSKQEPKKPSNKTYQKDSLSFSLPSGWKVEQDQQQEETRFLELNKYANYNVESTMGIGIYNEKQNTDSILSKQIKQLEYVYQKVNFKILEENKNMKIGSFDMTHTSYEGDDTQTKIYGKVGVIQDKSKTISVQIVERKPNDSGAEYETIFSSFIFK